MHGLPQPPFTLILLISKLNQVLQSNQVPFSMLEKGDYRLCNLLKTTSSLCSELHSAAVGATKNSAKVEVEHENMFWQKIFLGRYSAPKILQYTVFFYVKLDFCSLRIQEQYDVAVSQFRCVPQDRSVYDESVYYEYLKFISNKLISYYLKTRCCK